MSDEELVCRVQAGEEAYWPELAPRVLRMAGMMIGNRAPELHREDLQQKALVRFWRALPSYDPHRAGVRAFVAVLTQRTLIDFWRSMNGTPVLEHIDVLLDLPAPDAVALEPGAGLLAAIERIVGTEARRALSMHVFEGYTYREIGREIGKSEAAVKMMVRRALTRLRVQLEEQ